MTEEKPHWRTKVTISFTQEDNFRFERLFEKAENVLPGITKSQLIRIGLTTLEGLSEEKFNQIVIHTPEPKKGFTRTKDKERFECTPERRAEIMKLSK